jgi:hypothetical protein
MKRLRKEIANWWCKFITFLLHLPFAPPLLQNIYIITHKTKNWTNKKSDYDALSNAMKTQNKGHKTPPTTYSLRPVKSAILVF